MAALTGKVAIVTAASRGIGQAHCTVFEWRNDDADPHG
jgi:NAD(P)-dependent dehydrogenase (short-subunit alcohol dehydrogenase family)